MFSAPCRSTLVLFRGLDKPCGCVVFENAAEFRRDPRDFRRKIVRALGAIRTARSQQVSDPMHAVGMKLQSFMRMSCNRYACLARRSCAKIDAKPRGGRRNKSQKICAFRHGTRAQRATQAQKQIIDVLCAVQIHAGALHGLGEPCAQRWVRKRCRISPRSARFSPENRARFRRESHRTITESVRNHACSLHEASVVHAHVLQSLRVLGRSKERRER